MTEEHYEKEIGRLRTALEEADAVVIGAGAGLSTSAGFTYAGERFRAHFSDFAAKYDFSDMYSGGFIRMRRWKNTGRTGAVISISTVTWMHRNRCMRSCWNWCGTRTILC